MKFIPKSALEILANGKDLYPDKDRMLEAVLYLMLIHPGITQYQIAKSVFLADKDHLNRYGRPVTFDNYVAMKKGPAPNIILDLLRPERASLFREIYGYDPPWTISPRGDANHFAATRLPDMDVLSETDVDELRAALRKVRKLSPEELDEILHNDPAYVEAWSRRGTKGSVLMKMALLLDRDDRVEIIENLSYLSKP